MMKFKRFGKTSLVSLNSFYCTGKNKLINFSPIRNHAFILNSITLMSPECHAIANHSKLDCLFNSMFKLTSMKSTNLRIIGPLRGEKGQ